jgi:hypothetical protein
VGTSLLALAKTWEKDIHYKDLLKGNNQCLFHSWIRVPGWIKKIRIRDEQLGLYFRELRNNFFGLKYLNSLMRIAEPGWKKFGSGIKIPDPQHCGYNNKKISYLGRIEVVTWEWTTTERTERD